MQKIDPLSAIFRLLLLLTLFPVACNMRTASEDISGTQMAAANQLYEEGKFADAIAQYEKLVDAGVREGRLFYNLGGAYFKLGDLGRAVLNFRRAQRLLPRDGDVAANLSLARAQTLDRIEVENEAVIINLVRRLVGWTTLDEAATGVLTLWIILCGFTVSAILWRHRRGTLLYLAGGIATLLILGILSIGIRYIDEHAQPPAVVVAAEVEMRSGPGDNYLTEFTLHAGAEVRVVEQRGGWKRIGLSGDLQGWAPGEAVIRVSLE
jgi:tetratricopeptide (TPR) repeat protein